MSVTLTITDPAKTPRVELIAALALLEALSPGVLVAASGPTCAPLPPVDLPDVGADIPNPSAAFGIVETPAAAFAPETAETPAQAFGGSRGAPELDADAAKLEALAGPGAAGPTLQEVGLAAPLALPPVAGSAATSTPTTASLPPAPPSAPNVAAAPAPAGVELDADRLPWDARIHAKGDKGNKPKNADGRWRKKRGVDEALVAQVEGELRALMSLPAPAAAPNVPPTGAALTPPSLPPVPPAPPAPPAPTTVPSAPATIPSAPAGAPAGGINFVGLVQKCGQLTAAGKITQDEITAACQAVGIPALTLAVARPDLVPQIDATIDALVASKG